jgi:acyl-CoA reductase-like NAD-dependent aldehyde dehydrogenase
MSNLSRGVTASSTVSSSAQPAAGAPNSSLVIADTTCHYIGGRWARPVGRDTIEVTNPATEEVLGYVSAGDVRDVNRAVSEARAAGEQWARETLETRIAYVVRLGAILREHRDRVARMVTSELGMPLPLSGEIQVDFPINRMCSIGEHAQLVEWERHYDRLTVVSEPIGVVGAITPWNFPLDQAVAKLAPALVAGCTVVLKPSELTPLSTLLLGALAEQADLPPGVLNIVNGFGPAAGEALASHAGIDILSFTGSTRAGSRVSALAGHGIKPVIVELGGKSPSVVLDDAPLETAVAATVDSCYFNAGQTCSALTRLLVPRGKVKEAELIAVSVAEQYTAGDPLDPQTRLGPLISKTQQQRVRDHVRAAEEDGARLLLGGTTPPANLQRGHYFAPTVFSDVTPEMRLAQNEVFGPVLAIQAYDDVDDAVALANQTRYGLAAAVWGDDVLATDVANRIRAGQIQINGGEEHPLAPFGGFKDSGHGRELGPWGIEAFLAPKALLR